MKYISKIISFVAIVAIFFACSTKKNTATSRAFHKFTGHYNTYFNGYESYKEGVKKAEKIYPLTYDELLPVFAFSNEDTPNQVASDMDRAISKSNKVIEKHSITAKPEMPRGRKMNKEQREFYNRREFNDKVPQSHMLIAKAQAYNHDYMGSSATLEYMESQYAKLPILYESRIWSAIISTERDDLGDAQTKLTAISKIRNYPKPQHQLYHSAWANLLIKQQKYGDAVGRLQKALKMTKKHDVKVRYNFLLAQLYQKIGDKENSLKYFTKVSKMNAPYTVRFAAQICKANSFDPETQGGQLRNLYNKMLKDKKNEEYLDQIYYALGNLERQNKNGKKAVEYYQKSIDKNLDNTMQLGLSHLALADLFFVKPDFVKSFYNYKDSQKSLPQTHSEYQKIKTRVDMLEVLAPNLEIVEREDSLQTLARMSDSDRNKIIDSLIDIAKQKKVEAAKAEEDRRYYVMQSDMERYGVRENAATQGTNNANKWYFYNTSQVNQGLNEFNMRWGKRRLEDNWRRQNKGDAALDAIAETQEETIDAAEAADSIKTAKANKKAEPAKPAFSPDTKEYYLQDIPLTAEAMKASNAKVEQALIQVANAYRTDMKDNTRAIESYEDFVTRFPASEYAPTAYYYLYQLYSDAGNTVAATRCKDKLSSQYPHDILTMAITNPGYLQQLEQQETNAENAYEKALAMYHANRNEEALSIVNSTLAENPKAKILPQLNLLKVLSTNYEGNIPGYKKALAEISENYKGSDAAKAAAEMLKVVQDNEVKLASGETEETPTETLPSENYEPSDKEQYFALLVDKGIDANLISFEIILFNADLFLNENYETVVEPFNDNYRIILVKTLKNKKTASEYYNTLHEKSGVAAKLEGVDYLQFIITPDNLEKLKRSRNVAEYMQFFKANY